MGDDPSNRNATDASQTAADAGRAAQASAQGTAQQIKELLGASGTSSATTGPSSGEPYMLLHLDLLDALACSQALCKGLESSRSPQMHGINYTIMLPLHASTNYSLKLLVIESLILHLQQP